MTVSEIPGARRKIRAERILRRAKKKNRIKFALTLAFAGVALSTGAGFSSPQATQIQPLDFQAFTAHNGTDIAQNLHHADSKAHIIKVPAPQLRGSADFPLVAPVQYTSGSIQEIAKNMLDNMSMGSQWGCFAAIIGQESGWNPYAVNRSSGAYGIPQALPGRKMASAGADWKTNPKTQIKWAIGYMNARYGSPCGAYHFKFTQKNGWY